ncbi:MAG TPA: OmpA family protein [Spirochaetota bacterium]|nr:OmpA family protein [Spirochaetota bacterium]
MKLITRLFLSALILFPLQTIYAEGNVTVVNGVLNLPSDIQFIAGSDTIKNESLKIIDAIAEFLKKNTDVKILRIEGYCSSRADDNSNLELSKLRAMSVAKAVIARGVECRRLYAVGFGTGIDLLKGEKTGDRITAVVASGKFKKPGVMPVSGGGVVSGDTCK